MSAGTRRAALFVAAACVLAACGSESPEMVQPARVATELAPAKVGENLKLHENRDESTRDAFAGAGDNSMVADGRIWEIRRADRLIGTLQITTVLPRFDLRDEEAREVVVRGVIAGQVTRIRIGSLEVFTSVVNDKAMFLWFGSDLYQVVQLKDTELEGRYDEVVADIIEHQMTVPAWQPLPEMVESA